MTLKDLLKRKVVTMSEMREVTVTESEILEVADRYGIARSCFTGGSLFNKLGTLVAELGITVKEGALE